MHPFTITLIVFLIILLVEYIVTAIMSSKNSSTTTVTTTPDLQQAYDATNFQDNIAVELESKPFSVTSTTRGSLVRNAFSFTDATTGALNFTDNRLNGFLFEPQIAFNIVSLQYIFQYSPITTFHRFAIYDMVTLQEITTPLDSVVDSKLDPVDEFGFVTHTLATPIPVLAQRSYSIVCLVNANDLYGPFTMAQYLNSIAVLGSAFTPNTTTISLPATFGTTNTIRTFCSFQTQRVTGNPQSVFDVNLATGGFARFPPAYIRGLTIAVEGNGQNVLIDAGFASSQDNEANLVLQLGVSVSSQNGVNGLDVGTVVSGEWYYVYVIGSSNDITVKTAGLLSLGLTEPQVLPTGYDVFRRLGCVLASFLVGDAPAFARMRQEGDNTSRTTLFTGEVNDHLFFSEFTNGGTGTDYIPIMIAQVGDGVPLVPPPATRVSINVRGTALTVGPTVPQNNMLVRFRKRFADVDGVWIISVPNEASFLTPITIGLQAVPLPHETECRIYAVDGTVPAGTDYRLDFFVTAFFETI